MHQQLAKIKTKMSAMQGEDKPWQLRMNSIMNDYFNNN